jgi:hypothetical protein
MPDPVKINFGATIFNVPIQNGDMDTLVQQIRQKQDDIKEYQRNICNANIDIENYKQQLMVYQVQLTGSMNG